MHRVFIPVKPGPRGAKSRSPAYVQNNFGIFTIARSRSILQTSALKRVSDNFQQNDRTTIDTNITELTKKFCKIHKMYTFCDDKLVQNKRVYFCIS